jgi:hypothetical protein
MELNGGFLEVEVSELAHGILNKVLCLLVFGSNRL